MGFSIGEPDSDTPENIKGAPLRALKDAYTHYCPSAGIPPLRERVACYISRTRGIDVDPEEVVITPGVKPIIAYGILACVNEADEVIYPDCHSRVAHKLCVSKIPCLPLLEEKEFSFDPDDLEARVTDKTKMIIIRSPDNPTAGILTESNLELIASIVQEKDVWVLID